MIRLGPEPGNCARIPKRSAIAEAQAEGVVLWEMKKSAAREAWQEIKPSIDHIADIVVNPPAPHAA